ncbi:uncharacterized protein LOC120467181 [Pimephales promelas]|uniref:uncharacterized protein LOC120467181 n=1 Tax=Pimephales promelas TaxID=90988 RepID=UPI001955D52B|nr:uncharacterized protein LOC120467181 [Pimephales promelas]
MVAETVEKTPSETVGETVEESTQETEEEKSTQETVEESVDRAGKRKACGAATYRQENSCAHQGVTDVNRHVKSKGHQSKEQALQSASGIAKFYAPVSVGGITEQESKTRRAEKNAISWGNCASLSIDNAPVNTGAKNSISSRALNENGNIYIHGCPCHIIHNTAKHAGQRFLDVTGFDPEDLCVDVAYWFRGSTNRKGYLSEFCDLHESDYMEMLQHVSVRWLSLESCVNRILQRYEPLTSYFKSLDEKQPRFRRLVDAFSNPLTEVYLLFYQAT